MATKQQIIDDIISNYKAKEVTTTSGMNGYPEYLEDAWLVESWEDVEEILEKYPRAYAMHISKRDGWRFWEREGTVYEPFDMHGSFCANGRVIESQEDIIGEFGLDDPDFIKELPADRLASYLEDASKLLRKLDDLDDNQFIGSEFYDLINCDWHIYDKYQVYYSHDVYEHAIAIAISDEEDND